MAFRNNQPGAIGIAYAGSVCGIAKLRTSMIEYFVDDLRTGQVRPNKNVKFYLRDIIESFFVLEQAQSRS